MSNPSLHPTLEELSAYSLGQLPHEIAVAIDRHISECHPCCETMIGLSSDDTFVGLLKDARKLDEQYTGDEVRAVAYSSYEVPAPLAEHPRYEILSLIGKGGMGDVYKAIHRKMERTVALKVINRGLFRRSEVVDRFHREVKAAAQLSHPNIVTAYDADQAGDFHFMVMEYVDGVDLSRMVKDRGILPIAKACDYIRQAASGLQHAHQRGMVHRDIKPHNLMVTEDDTVKILDFGLASLAPEPIPVSDAVAERTDLTAAGAIMGTPDFISPEQAHDAHNVDIRSDIYSLGATLYYLLAGRVPFAEGSFMHKLKSHAESEPEPLGRLREDVPEELRAVVSRMMAKDPDERYLTPKDVVEALESFLRTWQPVKEHLPLQNASNDGFDSGSGDRKTVLDDSNPSWLPTVAKLLLYSSLLPLALLVLNEFVPLGLVNGETDWFWYSLLTSLVLSTIGGTVVGVHRAMTSNPVDRRVNMMTTEQTALIILSLAVYAVIFLTHRSDVKTHTEVMPQSDRMTLGTHPLTIVDTSGEKPLGGSLRTYKNDATGITTHSFESANGRFKISLVDKVLTVNGNRYTLEYGSDAIRILDDQVEITQVTLLPEEFSESQNVGDSDDIVFDRIAASNNQSAAATSTSKPELEISGMSDRKIAAELSSLNDGNPNGDSSVSENGVFQEPESSKQNKPAPNRDNPQSDEQLIQGEWRGIFAEDGGRTIPAESLGDIQLVITQDKLSLEVVGRTNVSTYQLDPSTIPKSIDLKTDGKTKPAIYDLQGDTLRLCMSEQTDDRPTSFDSQPNSVNDLVLTFKRVKSDEVTVTPTDEQSNNGPLTEEIARSLIPEAASMSNGEFQRLQRNPPILPTENESLSVVLLLLDVQNQSPEAASEFKFLVEGFPKPGEIAAAMSPSRSKGYFSIIQPNYITECKIMTSTDETAQGKVTFNAPQLYIGAVLFEARKREGKWKIVKFQLPARKVSILLGDDGNWERKVE